MPKIDVATYKLAPKWEITPKFRRVMIDFECGHCGESSYSKGHKVQDNNNSNFLGSLCNSCSGVNLFEDGHRNSIAWSNARTAVQ